VDGIQTGRFCLFIYFRDTNDNITVIIHIIKYVLFSQSKKIYTCIALNGPGVGIIIILYENTLMS